MPVADDAVVLDRLIANAASGAPPRAASSMNQTSVSAGRTRAAGAERSPARMRPTASRLAAPEMSM